MTQLTNKEIQSAASENPLEAKWRRDWVTVIKNVKVKQSCYRPAVSQRVPGS
jgi:hypothetical protein